MFLNYYPAKTGKQIMIREAQTEDAEALLLLARQTLGRSPHVVTTVEEFTLNKEEQENYIAKCETANNKVFLVAVLNGQITGSLNFETFKRKRVSHSGEFGMGVDYNFHNLGIGSALLQGLIDWATQEISIEKICLQVFTDNETAYNMYRKSGFIQEGLKVDAIKMDDGTYRDVYEMYLKV